MKRQQLYGCGRYNRYGSALLQKEIFTMHMQRRRYQVEAARHAYECKEDTLIVAPGGSGKTIIIGKIVRRARQDGLRVLIVSHRREIVYQTVELLRATRQHCSVILSGEESLTQAPVLVASIDTLRARDQKPDVDLVLVDECHRTRSMTYEWLISHYKRRDVKIIGLSATPYRLDGKGLGRIFDTMYEAVKPSAILGKYIAKPMTYSAAPEHLPDLVGLDRPGLDFKIEDLVSRVNKDGLIGGLVSTFQKHARDRTSVYFCCTVEHARNVVDAFKAVGVRAALVHGEMPKSARDSLKEQLLRKQVQLLATCTVLAEGWDLVDCDLVGLARPTRSLSLYIQMANRCARLGRRRPIILDHACNTVMHGFSWKDREWNLNGTMLASIKKPASVVVCPTCYYINDADEEWCEACGEDLTNEKLVRLPPSERVHMSLAEWSIRAKLRNKKKLLDFAKKHGLDQKWVKQVERLWTVT